MTTEAARSSKTAVKFHQITKIRILEDLRILRIVNFVFLICHESPYWFRLSVFSRVTV
jgi:hypothetical protein